MSYIRTRLQSSILWLILDRPPSNWLSSEMLDQLSAALRAAPEQQARLVVLMGAGEEAFSEGLEVSEQLDGSEKELLRSLTENYAAFEALRARGIATVALVKGVALGAGCVLATLCDTVLAHEQARFGLPEIDQGMFSPTAATRFPELLGTRTTLRLMLTGETISAREALRLGLVHQVLSPRRFLSDAQELLVMLVATAGANV